MNKLVTLNLNPIQITWIVIIAILAIVIIVFFCLHFFKKKPKVNDDKKPLTISNDDFFKYLGGKDNIISYKLVGSRLSLELKDYSLVNKEALKKENFDGIIEMKNKLILVKEDLSEELKALDNLKAN